ncbi:MAG: hypothetical protein PHZ26_01480 [Candidatus Gracilibacteria bacterium]|nr:hypothetical protein [Candidatus Gracilibacteria bacterium]MDD2908405.1 hypothetical protein [Candidatus Gracilibacteria bacterium]
MRLKCENCTSPIKKLELEKPEHTIIKSESGIGCVETENGEQVNVFTSPRQIQDNFGKAARRILCDNKEATK